MNREDLKSGAQKFLQSLEKELNSRMPSLAEMRKLVHDTVTDAKKNPTRKHMRKPEDAFLYQFAMPIIFRHMQTVDGIRINEAKQSLLSEYYRNMKDYCLQTPARTRRHPFTKIMGAKPADIVARWESRDRATLTQACPDFAFREPFPFKIVFEGKYFETGGAVRAKTELAIGAYQAFYYRALPYVPSKKSSPPWDYDFACLLACDASGNSSLRQVWDGLDADVKRGFWESANVYVMILQCAHSVVGSFTRG